MSPPNNRAKWAKWLVAAFVVVALLRHGASVAALLGRFPPAWADEAYFSNPALNLMRHGTMASDVLAGTLPGFERYTYWMPPVYFLVLAGVFSVVPPGLSVVRLVSAFVGALVLLMTFLLGRRAGLGRWLSLLPVGLLALDPVFLRASLVGRMDILAVFFIMSALYLALAPAKEGRTADLRQNLFTGVVAALAALTHPIGIVAPVAVVASRAFVPPAKEESIPGKGERALPLLLLLVGIAVPFLLYLVYILQDPASFAAQWAGQMARKTHVNPYTFGAVRGTLTIYAMLYSLTPAALMPKAIVLLLWLSGLAGLCVLGRACRPAYLLLLCQVVLFAVLCVNQEYWYAVYLAPLTHLGVAAVFGFALRQEARAWRLAAAVVAGAGLLFSLNGLETRAHLSYELGLRGREQTDYTAWTRQISDALPSGARALLAVRPDPYLGLCQRRDLILREYLPSNIPVPSARLTAFLEGMDYIVMDRDPSYIQQEIRDFVSARCERTARIGPEDDRGYVAVIYRVLR